MSPIMSSKLAKQACLWHLISRMTAKSMLLAFHSGADVIPDGVASWGTADFDDNTDLEKWE